MPNFGPPPPLTEDDLLDVLVRNLEDHWLTTLLEDPSTRSIFVGWAAAMLRIQEAADANFELGTFILTAPLREPATSLLRLNRGAGPEVILERTTRFQDERGAVWVPVEDTTIPVSVGAQTVDVPIQTLRFGYYLNSFAPLTYQAIDDLPDETMVIVLGPTPATGGKAPFLEQHGDERAQSRADGETAVEYSQRLAFLIDQVSPRALAEAATQVLDAFPLTKVFATQVSLNGLRPVREPNRDSAQPFQLGLTGTDQPYCDDAFLDDPFGYMMRDRFQTNAFFDVILPTIVDPDDIRAFFTSGFFDDPDFFTDLPPVVALLSPISALVDELDKRRAAGVRFAVYSALPMSVLRHPGLLGLAQVGDWSTMDGEVDITSMSEAVDRFRADDAFIQSAVGRGPLYVVHPGDLLYLFPPIPTPVEVSHVVLRAWVRRRDGNTGVDPVFSFMFKPTTAAAAERVVVAGFPVTIDHDDWREYVAILDQNPASGAAWTLGDIAGTFAAGVANMGPLGPTEDLLVGELLLDLVVRYE